jgi:ribonuclease VapC
LIAVDTSALIAIIRGEPDADRCLQRLLSESEVFISAGTLAEALIVAARQDRGHEMSRLVEDLQWRVAPVTEATAGRVADAYDRWGRGVHAARLNLGDCFAYEIAARLGCPLLYIGDDFSKTDLVSAL